MASVGLELSLDCIDDVKNSHMFQQTAANNSHVAFVGNHRLVTVQLLFMMVGCSSVFNVPLYIPLTRIICPPKHLVPSS